MKIPARKRRSESGQAILLVVLATSIFMLGAVGFAIDGSHLYAQRQMAQAAADAAAQAGILSIFNGSNATGTHAFSCPSTPSDSTPCFTCTQPSDARTPCYYAQTMNGFNSTGDVVKVYFPTASGVGVNTGALSSDPVNLLRVTITRPVKTTLMQLLGSSLSTIGANGTAAIVTVSTSVPIIVTHPTLTQAFQVSGTGSVAKIKICGGPPRSIEVNSSDPASVSANGNPVIDLSQAGPGTGTCGGTGGDFGDFGGPKSPPFVAQFGSGTYIQPASPILDPLSGVSAPSAPALARPADPLPNGLYGCPPSPVKPCALYYPGKYTSDIQVQNQTAVFSPGIYYMDNGASFHTMGGHGIMQMATGLTDSSTTLSVTLDASMNVSSVTSCCGTNQGWDGTQTNGGMLVYLTGPSSSSGDQVGSINIGANGSVNLVGSAICSSSPCAASPVTSYEGILFFVDRSGAAQTHTLDGGGGLTLVGTFYAPELLSIMTAPSTSSHYQTLDMQGGSGSNTNITGEIIVGSLSISGTPAIQMTLSGLPVPVRQVALVN